jgi:hypothetical protein
MIRTTAVALLAATLAAAPGLAQKSCDRTCLIEATDAYLAALVAHDPKKVRLESDAPFVENARRMKVGEGLWKTTTGSPTKFAIHVPDPVAHSAGWMGMMAQDGKPVQVAIALWFKGDRIVRVEHRVAPVTDNVLPRLQTPRAGLVTDVPKDKRLPRDELIRLGASYYDAVDDNDGTKAPFAADCQRHEGGIVTAGAEAGTGPASQGIPPIAKDCAGQLTAGVMAYITTISDRIVFAADPQTGLAMGFSVLRHPMDFAPYPVKSIDGTVTMFSKERLGYAPWDNVAAHIWKIGPDRKLHEIEAMGFRAPSGTGLGW